MFVPVAVLIAADTLAGAAIESLYTKPSPFENVGRERYLAESEHAFAIRDKHPKAPVHVLIISKARIPSLQQADPELVAEMVALAKNMARQEGIEQTGYRLVINTRPQGGQSLYHFHMHLLGGRQMAWPPG